MHHLLYLYRKRESGLIVAFASYATNASFAATMDSRK